MGKNIIIVGAGISGLSTGYYARCNGYRTSIFEMHSIPGGLCTAWERKGFRFDISMHMLTGSVSGPIHRLWEELGIPANFKFHYHDHMSRVEGMGKELTLSTERKRLEEDMLAISPEDGDLIREFISLLFGPDMMKAVSLKPKELRNIRDSIRMIFAIIPLVRTYGKYKEVTIQQFSARFKDPFLREAVRFIVDAPGWPMIQFPMVALSGFIRSGVTEAGVPLGGSQQVVYHIAELYKQLGGVIHLNSRVTNLVIENNRVAGIELEDGTQHRADYVIWAGDGHTLIYDILEGNYMNDRIRNMYENWIPVKSMVHIMMGVNRDLSDEPHSIIFVAEEPITIAGREHRWLAMIHRCFDKSMAPAGKSAVEVWYDSEYEHWEELSRNRVAYKAEKKRIADYTIRQLDKRWPGFASQIEFIDVPTPATYKRYTGNWKGSPDGWYITPDNMRENEPIRVLPGLDGLRMVGQWTAPFMGTVMSALSGRQVIQLMCKEHGRKFITQ
jgi:phytoene dehydrogenase-like protein